MTVWRAGMLAVKVSGRCTFMPKGTVALIAGVSHYSGATDDGRPYTGAVLFFYGQWDYPGGWTADNFRPAVEDRDPCEAEFITLLKRSKPAGAPQAPVVSSGGSKLSHGPAAAVAVSHTHVADGEEPQTLHDGRDQLSDLNGFVSNHEQTHDAAQQ